MVTDLIKGLGETDGKVPPGFLACAAGWDGVAIYRDRKHGGQQGLRFEFGGPLRQLEEVLGKYMAMWGLTGRGEMT